MSNSTFYYDCIHTDLIGLLCFAIRNRQLVAVRFGPQLSMEEFTFEIYKRFGTHLLQDTGRLREFREIFEAYLAREDTTLDLPYDTSVMTDFQQRVLGETRQIPYGQTSSYGEIARAIGSPNGSRAVGQALRRNPVPLVIPCHRVIASNGNLGGFSGEMGSPIKVRLLELEGVMLDLG